ncbi:MAG: hypothetical protein ACLU37_02250 [Collinsella sp.]
MGGYYRVACDSRDLNYDKFVVDGEVETEADESYPPTTPRGSTWPAPSPRSRPPSTCSWPWRAAAGGITCAYS